MRKIFSVLFWSYLAITSLLCFVIAVVLFVVTTPFDRLRKVNHLWACTWASLYAYGYPGWRVRTLHRQKIVPGRAYVMAANHTSVADIVLLFTLFRQFKWVSKSSNFRLPLIGWNMSLSGYVPLVRGDQKSTHRMMERCRGLLQRGMSIMMFPEGTRSKDGQVKPFKAGAFVLARDTGVPVLPIAIHGGHQLIPKHGSAFATRAALTVEVLDPISPGDYPDVVAFADATRARIQEALFARPETAPRASYANSPAAQR